MKISHSKNIRPRGGFEMDNREGEDNTGKSRMSHVIMVTAKGRVKLCQRLQQIKDKENKEKKHNFFLI